MASAGKLFDHGLDTLIDFFALGRLALLGFLVLIERRLILFRVKILFVGGFVLVFLQSIFNVALRVGMFVVERVELVVVGL